MHEFLHQHDVSAETAIDNMDWPSVLMDEEEGVQELFCTLLGSTD